MTEAEFEAKLRQTAEALAVGMPPASINPKIQQAAADLMMKAMEIMMRFGIISPTVPATPVPVPPPPPPPAPPGSRV